MEKELDELISKYEEGNMSLVTLKAELLRLFSVVGRSEQLLCPICSSDNIDAEFNHYNFCRDCNHDWEK
jgi:hypothetical protein